MGIGEDETLPAGVRPAPGALVRALGCPDGVWVGSCALEAQEPFWAKQKPLQGKHGDRILRLWALFAISANSRKREGTSYAGIRLTFLSCGLVAECCRFFPKRTAEGFVQVFFV